jgi:hypothetical protein
MFFMIFCALQEDDLHSTSNQAMTTLFYVLSSSLYANDVTIQHCVVSVSNGVVKYRVAWLSLPVNIHVVSCALNNVF